jgi:hypothetical protein
MNHSWTPINGREVKNELAGSRKRCRNCLMEVRYIRMGGAGAHKGFTETQYRPGPKGEWRRAVGLPFCKACRTCPTCAGTGVITRQKFKEVTGD